jgi:hypothetical protein
MNASILETDADKTNPYKSAELTDFVMKNNLYCDVIMSKSNQCHYAYTFVPCKTMLDYVLVCEYLKNQITVMQLLKREQYLALRITYQ